MGPVFWAIDRLFCLDIRMKFLNAQFTCAVVKMKESLDPMAMPLTQYAQSLTQATPYVVLDLGGALLTSAMIGDIINFAKALSDQWGSRFVGVGLVNVSDHGAKVLHAVKLDPFLRVYDNLDQAIGALETKNTL